MRPPTHVIATLRHGLPALAIPAGAQMRRDLTATGPRCGGCRTFRGRTMRRLLKLAPVIAILMASVVLTTGAVLASTGIVQLQVFEPGDGSLDQRLTTVEDFLIQHSSDLALIVQPATCPTA